MNREVISKNWSTFKYWKNGGKVIVVRKTKDNKIIVTNNTDVIGWVNTKAYYIPKDKYYNIRIGILEGKGIEGSINRGKSYFKLDLPYNFKVSQIKVDEQLINKEDIKIRVVEKEPLYTYVCNSQTGKISKLEWQDDEDCSNKTFTFKEALEYAKNKGKGWRVPTIEELQTIIDRNNKHKPTIIEGFDSITSSSYWSSTTVSDNISNAWTINFWYGDTSYNNKNSSKYVRCVRDVE